MLKRTVGAFWLLLFCCCVGGTAQAQGQRCFENDGLKLRDRVCLVITGHSVRGTFATDVYDLTAHQNFTFTGKRRGHRLIIQFPHNYVPYPTPPHTRHIVWILNKNSLRIPFYGKNYQTQKYSTYLAVFKPSRK